jgi:DnaJ-domain-containing protein 1
MGQLFDRIKNFVKVSAADAVGDLDRAQHIIDAEDDELRRIIDELRTGTSGGSSERDQPHGSRQPPPSATAIPSDVLTAARILGIAPTATADVVKRAYRTRIAAVHPDRMAQRTPAEQRRAEEEAKAVNAAYATMQRYLGNL